MKRSVLLSFFWLTLSVINNRHYFYPDMPSGYQITQSTHPLGKGGVVKWGENENEVSRIQQVQLEQDSGKLLNVNTDDGSFVGLDLNRYGKPLIEIVFDPDLTSGASASSLVSNLRRILQNASICDGRMDQVRASYA